MKNLKKLTKRELKMMSGGISYPFPGECVYDVVMELLIVHCVD